MSTNFSFFIEKVLTRCILITALFSFIHLNTKGQVRFEQTKDFYLLLQKAEKEKKLLFIDGYTNWCGWCKELDRKVFCAGAVADTINAHFIAASFEMEKDSFGVLLARKYAISGFPTALILTPKGELVSFLFGYSPPSNYLNRINEVLMQADKGKTIAGYSTSLHIRFPDFYTNSFPFGGTRLFPDSLTINTYLAAQWSLTDEVSWNIINRFSSWLDTSNESRIFSVLDSLNDLYGTVLIQSFLNNFIGNKIYSAIRDGNAPVYHQYINLSNQYLSSPESFLFACELEWLKKQKQWNEYIHTIEVGLHDSSLEISAEMVNQYCWDVYTDCPDLGVIKQATGLMKNTVLKDNDTYAYHDTYASLLYKSGDFDNARTEAMNAIGIGNKSGEDVSSTKALLEKINASAGSKK